MILWIVRRWRWTKDQYRRLSGRQRGVVFYTVILPTLVMQPLLILFSPSLPVVVGINLLWCVVATMILASAMNDDRTTTERLVDQKAAHLSGAFSQLREDFEDAKADYRQRLDELERVMRNAFAELDVVLPPRRISLRGRATSGPPSTSLANLSVKGRSKMRRFRLWIRRAWRRVWEMIYGTPDDG